MRKKNSKHPDAEAFARQKYSLLRRNRVVVRLNDNEKAALDEYCARCKASSRSAMVRQILMERVLQGLSDTHPTLF